MYIIVGLGNPGQKYEGTRHNIGFSAITTLADEYNISVDSNKHKAYIGKGTIDGQKVILVKPVTYMNLSGESIRELVNYYKINPKEELIVIYDDIHLDPGKLRIRAKGSAGGHNGIKSVIQLLETQEFIRVRIGVGGKLPGRDLAEHVLSRFPIEEEAIMRESLRNAAEACRIMSEDINAAMNQFN